MLQLCRNNLQKSHDRTSLSAYFTFFWSFFVIREPFFRFDCLIKVKAFKQQGGSESFGGQSDYSAPEK